MTQLKKKGGGSFAKPNTEIFSWKNHKLLDDAKWRVVALPFYIHNKYTK